VLSGRGLCDGLFTRPEESYRLWRVVVCDQEPSNTRRLKPATGLWKIQPQWVVKPGKQTNNITKLVIMYLQASEKTRIVYFARRGDKPLNKESVYSLQRQHTMLMLKWLLMRNIMSTFIYAFKRSWTEYCKQFLQF